VYQYGVATGIKPRETIHRSSSRSCFFYGLRQLSMASRRLELPASFSAQVPLLDEMMIRP
jgi:hypothetical protein